MRRGITMRANLLTLLVLLAIATILRLPSVECISRYEENYGPPEKAVNKPLQEKAVPAKSSASNEESGVYTSPKKVNQEESDGSDVNASLNKKVKENFDYINNKFASPDKKEKEKSDDLNKYKSPKKQKEEKSEVPNESTSMKKEKKDKPDSSDESSSSKKEKKSGEFVSSKKDKEKSYESASLKKEKKEKSDEYAASPKKEKKESSASSKKEKKEKSQEDSDVYESTSPKKEKKDKPDGSDEYASRKKEKKEKFDESASSKKEKKEKSQEDSESGKKEKKKKSDDESKEKSEKSDEHESSKKKEKKEKSEDSKKEKKEKHDEPSSSSSKKKKEKSDEASKAEKPDEDPTPVDVSTNTGEYVQGSNSKSEEEKPKEQLQEPATSSPDQSKEYKKITTPVEQPAAPATSSADAYSAPAAQVDEQPPAANNDAPTTLDGSPDQQPPTPATDAYAAAAVNNKKKPKVTLESLPATATAAVPAMVKSMCAQTDTPDLCESSIAGLPSPAPPQLDGTGVLKLAMEAVRLKVVEAINAATDRMHEPGTDAVSRNALNACLETYDDMKSSIDTANDALDAGDLGTASTNLDAVSTDVSTCDEGFLEHDLTPLMADHNDFLTKMCGNLLAIGTALKKH